MFLLNRYYYCYFNKKVDAKIYVIKIKILFLQKNESNN